MNCTELPIPFKESSEDGELSPQQRQYYLLAMQKEYFACDDKQY